MICTHKTPFSVNAAPLFVLSLSSATEYTVLHFLNQEFLVFQQRKMAPLRNRYKYLPFFASPLEEHSEHNHGHASHAPIFPEDFESAPEKGQIKHETRPAHARELTFREREEASSIELFYDLFFVANLSSFTGTHDIDSATSKFFDTSLILLGTTVLTRP